MTAFWPVLNTPTTAYTVQPGLGFLAPEYLASQKAQHPACDLNAVTGKDTDLGDPVHAADDGEVTATGFDGYIGGMVEIRHGDGSTSGYWHLRDIHVRIGQRVQGGDFIGQIGKGGPRSRMHAHLHFYVKKAGVNLPLSYWPSTHEKDPAACAALIRAKYHNPTEWLKARGAKRTVGELQAQRSTVTVTHAQPDRRVLVNNGQGEWPDYNGKTLTITGAQRVVINTTDPAVVWVRYLDKE